MKQIHGHHTSHLFPAMESELGAGPVLPFPPFPSPLLHASAAGKGETTARLGGR